MSILLKPFWGIVANGIALWAVVTNVEGIVYAGEMRFFVLGGVILGLVNFFVKPLIKLISLPFIVVSGGLFLIVINVGVLWFLGYFFSVAQFQDVALHISGLESYLVGALLLGVVNWAISLID